MNFEDTAEEAEFRAEVRAFLDKHAEPKDTAKETFRQKYPKLEDAIAAAKDFQAKKADAKLAVITWPEAYGGRGASQMMQVIYNQEEAKYVVSRGFFEIGLGMCIPTILTCGNDADKDRFAKPASRGEEIWCQLFSEPAAGSDVAGIRTRAERDGDDWVINGQKIWTSGAHFSDYGIIITRTDPNVPKHQGLTMFWVDMKAPGVEARPIQQISGDSNFNEVYFTDVRIPDGQRIGPVGGGWKVSLTTLMNERMAVGESAGPEFDDVFRLAREVELEDGPAIKNAAVREKLAEWYCRQAGLRNTRYRAMSALSRGATPGPEASIGKVVSAARVQEMANFGMELQEMGGVIWDPSFNPQAATYQYSYLQAPSNRIAGGTDEILRNILAERVLGLPGDIRVDKDQAFNQLPTGKT